MNWAALYAILSKKIDDISALQMKKVTELPETGETNTLYLVPKTTAEEGNYSDEYIWDADLEEFEKVGDTLVDPLPEVTAADNGKILGVANGEWGKVDNEQYHYLYVDRKIVSNNVLLVLKNNKTIQDVINACTLYGFDKVALNLGNGAIFYPIGTTNTYAFYHIGANAPDGSGDFSINYARFESFYPTRNYAIENSYALITNTSSDSSFSSTSTRPVQNKIIKQALELKTKDASIAATYSTSSTYDLGDLVIYNNNLYECTTAITVAEAWTAAHWTQVNISDELDKKANLTETTKVITLTIKSGTTFDIDNNLTQDDLFNIINESNFNAIILAKASATTKLLFIPIQLYSNSYIQAISIKDNTSYTLEIWSFRINKNNNLKTLQYETTTMTIPDISGRFLTISAANSYATSNIYNTNDIVSKNDRLYKCKEDNVTGSWNSSKWDTVTVLDVIDSKISDAVTSVLNTSF